MKACRRPLATLVTLLALAGFLRLTPAPRAADKETKVIPPELKTLKYRSIGPAAGGRVSRAVGVPGDPRTYYAATAAGGVWKSTDGGILWKPIFDDQPVSSIGCIAVAPSDPNVIYVGSGEANIRGNVQPGNGIYKSTDAGKHWKHVWKQEGQIGTLVVHPKNADVAYAAVLGHAFGPNKERGVYRTTDGGKNWKKVLFKDNKTGASDVCLDPTNPTIVFAGLWQARRRPWELTSGGPGSGLYVSRDGGDNWKQLTGNGLPEGIWGKVGVAVAPSDPDKVYALIEAKKGGLFRSDDGGAKWKRVNGGHYLRQRAWYYSTLTIDPKNPNVVWCPNVKLVKSIDGGQTFKKVLGTHHGDHHDIWIDPKNPKRVIDSNDGGVDITINGGETWYAPRLPIAQFYHVACDNRTPYWCMGNMQDLGTAAVPSNSLSTAGITFRDWESVGGGETGFAVPDPVNPNIVYAGEYGGVFTRYDRRTRQVRNVTVYPTNPSGKAAKDLDYRFQWTAPILVSNHDHKKKVVYHAANVLFKTTDGGQTWKTVSPDLTRDDKKKLLDLFQCLPWLESVSPDLTRDDKAKQRWSGGPITGDNTTAEYYCTIFALAESPLKKGLLWAGSDDGLVHLTRNGGKKWVNLTDNIPGIPKWGTVCCIEPSPFGQGTAYLVVDNHRMDDMKPYLYRTTDFGQTWKSLTAKLPQDVFLRAVREDPKKKGLLYLGTEKGVSYSPDDGKTWRRLKLNLPTVAVTDLVVKGNDLVVATNGRSIWILDDLTPLRDSSWRKAKGTTLLPAAPAVRWRYHHPVYGSKDIYAAQNPAAGAIIHYYLKAKPIGKITLEIFDAKGNFVDRLTSDPWKPEIPKDDPDASGGEYKKTVLTTKPGINRVSWDLRYLGATPIKKAKIDSGIPIEGPLVLPGEYTLKLNVERKTFQTKVKVLPDPRVHLPKKDLEEQLKLALTVRDDITKLAGMVEQLRLLRAQLRSRETLLKDNAKARPLIKLGQKLVAKLDELEGKLHNPKAEVVYDILAQKGGAQLYSQLGYIFEALKDADGPPTQGIRTVYAAEKKNFQKYGKEWKALITGDLAWLNEKARKLKIPDVIVPAIGKTKDTTTTSGKGGVPKGYKDAYKKFTKRDEDD
jgi:photosystem II stability/assembly factor-like uncharacterized protein